MSTAVRQAYIDAMGEELGSQFHGLSNECLWLHEKWNDYVALFGVSQRRLDILNAAAPGFFRRLDDTLWRDLLLHLCTLTDEPEVRRRQTLTICRLPRLVDPAIRDKVRNLVSAAIKKTKFARDWRDRHIAYRDLKLALQRGAKPLAPASRKRVSEALAAIVAVLGAVDVSYCKLTTAYELVSHLGDAQALLHVLRDGVDARDDRLRRMTTGLMLTGEPSLNFQRASPFRM